MRSKKHLLLFATLCGYLAMAGAAAAVEFTVSAANLGPSDRFTIEVNREDGESLDTAVFDVFVELGDSSWILYDSGTGSANIDAYIEVPGNGIEDEYPKNYDVILDGIDADLVSGDWSSEDATVFVVEVAPVDARIRVSPGSLNVGSGGNWINCKIQLPNDYPVDGIRTGTVEVTVSGEVEQEVEVDGEMQTQTVPYEITDIRTSRVKVMRKFLMVKIDRSDITDELATLGASGTALVTVVGELDNGLYFEGSKTIKVINNTNGRQNRARARGRTRDR